MHKTVLLVDDSMMIRRIVGQLLRETGYAVLLADNGREGYLMARSRQPDLVLMDIEMPVMDGIEATGRLKADASTSHIPVLIFSSLGSEEDQHQARLAGCQGFINKPICKTELQESINSLLHGKKH